MISRRNFMVAVTMMAVIFFLFMFSQVMKESGNDYEVNKYAKEEPVKAAAWKSAVVDCSTGTQQALPRDWQNRRYVAFVGDTSSNVGSIVSQWALYAKRNMMTCRDVYEIEKEKYGKPEFVIIDSTVVDFEKDFPALKKFTEDGLSLIFCNLPSPDVIENNPDLMYLLGIQYVAYRNYKVEGYHLFGGFLLGGETLYKVKEEKDEKRQDLELNIPWYVTLGGTKTYMVGMLEDSPLGEEEARNEYLPGLIWRNSLGDSQVIVVNGDFMSTTTGLGILNAMVYELSTYQIYPVVNAQNTLLTNYPLMTNENADEMQRIYERSAFAVETDIIWPRLISLAEKSKLKYTTFLAPRYDYASGLEWDPSYYAAFLGMFNEREVETGMSLQYLNSTLTEKTKQDEQFLLALEKRYKTSSAFIDKSEINNVSALTGDSFYLKDLRTIACDADIKIPILSYLDDDITLQSLTSTTRDFTYSEDLMLKSIETALGYNNAKLNLEAVIWPNGKADQWENIYDDMSSALDTYWKPFEKFDQTTLTESDERVRTFLNLDYSEKREGDVIKLNVSGTDGKSSWFILRTHGEEIKSISGGGFERIENATYLIRADEEEISIELRSVKASATFK